VDICHAANKSPQWHDSVPLWEEHKHCAVGVLSDSTVVIPEGGVRLTEIVRCDASAPIRASKTCRVKRESFAIAVMNDIVYACGGWDDDAIRTVECYDAVADEWSCLSTDLATLRTAHCTVACAGALWSIGGAKRRELTSERLDPREGLAVARLSTPLPTPRINAQAVALPSTDMWAVFAGNPVEKTTDDLRIDVFDARASAFLPERAELPRLLHGLTESAAVVVVQ